MSRTILTVMAVLGMTLSQSVMGAEPERAECPQDLWQAGLEAYEIGLHVPPRPANTNPGVMQDVHISSQETRREAPIIQLQVNYPGGTAEQGKTRTKRFELTPKQGAACLQKAKEEVAKWQKFIDTHVDLSKHTGTLSVEQGLNSGRARGELNITMHFRAQNLEHFWHNIMRDRPGGPVSPPDDEIPGMKELKEKHAKQLEEMQAKFKK